MANLLEQAAGWLDRMRTAHLSRNVTYCRGAGSVQVAATVGRTVFEVENAYGIVEKAESRDFLVSAASLVMDGQVIRPQRGDQISDDGRTYEVMAPGNEDVCRPADPYGITLRIHTKFVSNEPIS
ncbi:MAG: hypothetical protein WC869_11175 [Phycisphaerae bacterium]